MTGQSPPAGNTDQRGHGGGSAHAVPPMHAPYLRTAILPSAVIAVICALAAAVALLDHASAHVVRMVLAGVGCGVVAVLAVADKVLSGRADQRVEIFVNLARRMQSLVHREIELLDDLEAQVEDPDLLKGLFTVDHLATRMRRQSESLAVLGGSASRRQWTRQVTMHEVLRAAVAEVEHYSRVKVVPPVEGVLRGAAVTDVIHLIAELVETATKFSAPQTTALLRAQHVSAGLAIEVEDRGLGIPVADQQRMNDLLADPSRMDIDELLRDGRIGLYVVASLARRHGIKVRLQNNIYGGTQAVVVLPKQLLEQPEADRALPRGDFGEEDPQSPRLALVPAGALPSRRPSSGASGASGAAGADAG